MTSAPAKYRATNAAAVHFAVRSIPYAPHRLSSIAWRSATRTALWAPAETFAIPGAVAAAASYATSA